MKKMFLSLLVLVSAIAIIGCNTKNGNTKLEALEEPENVYAISVVNGIEQILSTNTGIYLMNDSADVKEDGTYKATTVYKSDEAGFKYKYINELGWDYEEINPQGWDNRYIAIDNEVLNITDTVEAWKDGGYKGV